MGSGQVLWAELVVQKPTGQPEPTHVNCKIALLMIMKGLLTEQCYVRMYVPLAAAVMHAYV